VRAVTRLCEFYPGICLTTEEKARKNVSQGKKNLSQVKKNLNQSRFVLYNRGRVFTARYVLSPYMKQTRLVFKGLSSAMDGGKRSASRAVCYPPGETATHIHCTGDCVGPLAFMDYKEMRKTSRSCLESNHCSWVV
jgi:hypothetical protein